MMGFWRNWTTAWCWTVIASGLVLAGGAFEPTSGLARLAFHLLHGPAPLDLDPQMRFSLGVLGAVTAGWGVTLLAAIAGAHRLADQARPVWLTIAAGTTVWFAIDTPISIATGYGLNAIPNLAFWGGLMLPLLRSGVLRRG